MQNNMYKTPESATTGFEPDVEYCDSPLVSPCLMTIDELRTELRQSVEDARNGLYITIEQARKRHPRLS